MHGATIKNILKVCVTDGNRQANRMYRAASNTQRISIVTRLSIGRTDRVCRGIGKWFICRHKFGFCIVGSIIGLLPC